MKNKQLIKQEIERIIEEETPIYKGSDYYHGAKESMEKLLQFIDSLPEEPVSEEKLEKELAETYLAVFDKKYPILPTLKGKQKADFKNFLNKCQQEFGLKEFGIHPTQSKLFEKLTLLWAVWGAEHLKGLGKSNQDEFDKEPASEDLEEYAKKLSKGAALDKHNLIWMCKKGAEWQKQKHDKQFGFLNLKDCKDAYNEWKSTQDNPSATLAWIRACEWQKRQMMKDAVEGIVGGHTDIPAFINLEIEHKPNVKVGDKVKIVVLKN